MGPNWNEQAPTYDQLVFCELDDTRSYLDAAGVVGSETVLDVCCGPGRFSVMAAERGCKVVGIDSAEKMLEHARANAESFGVADRCDFRLLDWNCVLPGQNVERADVVIASRCRAMMDVEKLSSLAKEKVVVQIFADSPSIPALKNVIFDGCGSPSGGPDSLKKPGQDGAQSAPPAEGGPAGPGGPRKGPKHLWPPTESGYRAGCAYLDVVLKAYAAGYDPNVRIMPERFRKRFGSRDEAISWICSLDPRRSEGNEERVAMNVEPLLKNIGGEVEFCIATTAAIIWWDVAGAACWSDWKGERPC